MLLRRTTMFAVSAGFFSPAMAATGNLDEEVRKAYQAWDAAFGRSDAKAIGAFYTSDAFFLPPTHEII
jgi:ketosteroid isomerase-like protein